MQNNTFATQIMTMTGDASLNALAQQQQQAVKNLLRSTAPTSLKVFEAETKLTDVLTQIKQYEARQQENQDKANREAWQQAYERRHRMMEDNVLFY